MLTYLFAGVYVDPISALPIPRALGQGNAYGAVKGDIYSAYYNPAGLINVKGTEFSAISTTTMLDVSLFNISAAMHKSFGTFFAGYSSLGVGSIKEMAYVAGEIAQVGSITNSNYALSLGYANIIFNSLEFGFVLNNFSTALDSSNDATDYSASAMALNLGLKYEISEQLALGLTLRNINGATMDYSDTYNDEIPAAIIFGTSYTKDIMGKDYNFFLDVENQTNGFETTLTSMGVATSVLDNIFVRGGLRGVPEGVNGEIKQQLKLTCGLGFKWQGLMADYAYYPGYGEDENKHYISVSLSLGESLDSAASSLRGEASYE